MDAPAVAKKNISDLERFRQRGTLLATQDLLVAGEVHAPFLKVTAKGLGVPQLGNLGVGTHVIHSTIAASGEKARRNFFSSRLKNFIVAVLFWPFPDNSVTRPWPYRGCPTSIPSE